MLKTTGRASLRVILQIFLCFLLTSTGYFIWMNRLERIVPPQTADYLTTVLGYVLQAVGVGVYALLLRRGVKNTNSRFAVTVGLYAVLLIPVAFSHSVTAVVLFGLAGSLLCGVVAGEYLLRLANEVPLKQRAIVFGVAYGLTTVVSWLFTLIPHFYENGTAVLVSFGLAAAAVAEAFVPKSPCEKLPELEEKRLSLRRALPIIIAVVVLFSLVNNLGFATQSAEIAAGLRLEFSRMFYAIGLLAAGIVGDKSRKYGAVCALAALAVPFITLALQGESVPLTVFWALSYLGFGFYAVFRITVFSDFAARSGRMYLSGLGLLFGRLGDAVGTAAYLMLGKRRMIIIILTAVLFAASVVIFFRLYHLLYESDAQRVKSERELFHAFAVRHDLSQREREVMKLLIADKTNKEIAEALFVSESTAKFHVHNLLKKTGTKSRLELVALYMQSKEQSAEK